MDVLVEVHGYHRDQIDVASRVDRVYDFALPPLAIDALTTGDADPLRSWIGMRPSNAINVLDTHDGIGVIDVGVDQRDRSRPGLLPPARIHELVEGIHERSNGESRRATGASASNLDLYQVNCTFYDALGRDDARYLAARMIQLMLPGVPQIYYVGLLAGTNDMELLAATGVGRDVNRHRYTDAEVDAAPRTAGGPHAARDAPVASERSSLRRGLRIGRLTGRDAADALDERRRHRRSDDRSANGRDHPTLTARHGR